MAIPKARVLVSADGRPLIAAQANEVHLCIGVSTAGPLMEPRLVQYDALTSTFRGGPAVKAGAYVADRNEASVIFVRVPATARAASTDVRLGSWTGESSVTASGTPTQYALVAIKSIVAGTVNSAGSSVTYQVSLDGGATYGATTPLGTSLTILANGITFTFENNKSFEGTIFALCIPASASIYAESVTKDGASGTMDLSGTPIDQYQVIWEVVAGGTTGVGSKLTYRYSLDGGRSYSAEKRLGDGLTADLVDYVGDGFTVQSGLTMTLQSASAYKAGDVLVARTMPPEAQASDILLAIDAVESENQFSGKYGFIHAVGNLGRLTDVQAFQAKLAALADSSQPAYTMLLTSGRDRGPGEPEAEWEAEQAALLATTNSDRVAASGGYCRITDPCGGHVLRRPVAFRIAERLISQPMAQALHDFSVGSIDDADIFDERGKRVEHDARVSSTLHDARYITMRTRKNRSGVWFTSSKMLAEAVAPGKVGFDNIMYRRIMDVASAILQATGEDQLGRGLLFINRLTGLPDEGGAQSFDALIAGEIEEAISVNGGTIAQGALGVQVKLDRNTPITGANAKLKAAIRVLLLGFVGEFEGRLSLVRKL